MNRFHALGITLFMAAVGFLYLTGWILRELDPLDDGWWVLPTAILSLLMIGVTATAGVFALSKGATQ